jgi:hypothetical protein
MSALISDLGHTVLMNFVAVRKDVRTPIRATFWGPAHTPQQRCTAEEGRCPLLWRGEVSNKWFDQHIQILIQFIQNLWLLPLQMNGRMRLFTPFHLYRLLLLSLLLPACNSTCLPIIHLRLSFRLPLPETLEDLVPLLPHGLHLLFPQLSVVTCFPRWST